MTKGSNAKEGFRWGRFFLTLLIVGLFGELGGRGEGAVSDPGLRMAREIGRLVGVLLVTILIYALDSTILRRRQGGRKEVPKNVEDDGNPD